MSHRRSRQAPDEGTGDTTAYTLRAEVLDESDTSAAAPDVARVWGVEAAPNSTGTLVVKRGPDAGARFRLDQPVLTAGRHPTSDIFLDDITVSRRHAEFRMQNGRFHIVDLSSLNSTYLNWEPVDSAPLANGDEIQIGNFRLVFLTTQQTG
jgi:pSer/pThr/pTyr-binding forkhead associated (FHA) protein